MFLKSVLTATAMLASTSFAQHNYSNYYSNNHGGDHGDHSGDYPSSSSASTQWPTTALNAFASSSTAAAPAYSSPPGTILVQIVDVSDSNGSFSYSPENIVAEPNTLIQFRFHPKNHTVTQSTFAQPCMPIGLTAPNLTTPTTIPIKSGFVPVLANASTTNSSIFPTFDVLVNDTKPIWLYCGQLGHCQKGMAMVVNQNMSDTVHTLDNYKIAAAQVPLPNVTVVTTVPSYSSISSSTSALISSSMTSSLSSSTSALTFSSTTTSITTVFASSATAANSSAPSATGPTPATFSPGPNGAVARGGSVSAIVGLFLVGVFALL